MSDSADNPRTGWLTEPKNLLVVALLLALMLTGTALIVGTYDVVHAPLPYELRTDAMANQYSTNERISNDEKELHTNETELTNHLVGVDNHLDDIDSELDRLDRAAHLARKFHHYHK